MIWKVQDVILLKLNDLQKKYVNSVCYIQDFVVEIVQQCSENWLKYMVEHPRRQNMHPICHLITCLGLCLEKGMGERIRYGLSC